MFGNTWFPHLAITMFITRVCYPREGVCGVSECKIFSYIRRLGTFWGRGDQKNAYVGGMKIFFFWGGGGHCRIGLFLAVTSMHFRDFC